MVDMGFQRDHAEEALRRVGVPSVEVATEWLLSNPDPDITAPPEEETEAAAGAVTEPTAAAAAAAGAVAAAASEADDEVPFRAFWLLAFVLTLFVVGGGP